MNLLRENHLLPGNIRNLSGLAGVPQHGGDRVAASRFSGLAPEEILDFSVNINPLGPPANVQTLNIYSSIQEYPDSGSHEFQTSLSSFLDISPENITVTSGSTELIYLLPILFKDKKSVAIINPCFSEYEHAFRLASVPVHNLILPRVKFAFEIDPFLFKLRQIPNLGGIILGSPNNPTGSLWKQETLSALLHYCEQRRIYLIIDEAFVDFVGGGASLIKHIGKTHRLILVRSMTKIFAIPGLRLGYGVMHPDIIDKIETHRPPWTVNGPAQIIGTAVLADHEYLEKSRTFVKQEVLWLSQNMEKMCEVYPTTTNFFLFRLRRETLGTELFKSLLNHGILIRNCSNFKGLDSSFFRIAARKREENEILISKLKNLI